MVRSRHERRRIFGEKVLDLANYALTALVFGQIVAVTPISPRAMIGGLWIWFVAAAAAWWLIGES